MFTEIICRWWWYMIWFLLELHGEFKSIEVVFWIAYELTRFLIDGFWGWLEFGWFWFARVEESCWWLNDIWDECLREWWLFLDTEGNSIIVCNHTTKIRRKKVEIPNDEKMFAKYVSYLEDKTFKGLFKIGILSKNLNKP